MESGEVNGCMRRGQGGRGIREGRRQLSMGGEQSQTRTRNSRRCCCASYPRRRCGSSRVGPGCACAPRARPSLRTTHSAAVRSASGGGEGRRTSHDDEEEDDNLEHAQGLQRRRKLSRKMASLWEDKGLTFMTCTPSFRGVRPCRSVTKKMTVRVGMRVEVAEPSWVRKGEDAETMMLHSRT